MRHVDGTAVASRNAARLFVTVRFDVSTTASARAYCGSRAARVSFNSSIAQCLAISIGPCWTISNGHSDLRRRSDWWRSIEQPSGEHPSPAPTIWVRRRASGSEPWRQLLQRQQPGNRVVPMFQQIELLLLPQPLLFKAYHHSHQLPRRKFGLRIVLREYLFVATQR